MPKASSIADYFGANLTGNLTQYIGLLLLAGHTLLAESNYCRSNSNCSIHRTGVAV